MLFHWNHSYELSLFNNTGTRNKWHCMFTFLSILMPRIITTNRSNISTSSSRRRGSAKLPLAALLSLIPVQVQYSISINPLCRVAVIYLRTSY